MRERGIELGLAAVGFTTAEVLEPARTTLQIRKASGLNGEMQFTYRNPIRSTDPRHRLPKARSLVVAALGYGSQASSKATSDTSGAGVGRLARYVWDDYYGRLREILDDLADALHQAGYRAQVLIDSNNLVDRNAAWRAGLGWYGKNSNLLLPDAGSWYVLGSILTDAPFEPLADPVDDGCGPCRRCIDDCPTDAIISPGVVDGRRCIAWLVQAAEAIPVEFRVAVGDRMYGCDDCQEVCPPNRLAAAISEAEELRVDIEWILTADDGAILDRHGRWYIANRDVNVIRRTALVVLGNTAEPSWGTARIAEHLNRSLASESTLVRNHAVWAARRLGFRSGLERIEVHLPRCCDPGQDCEDPELHVELTCPVEVRFSAEQWEEQGRESLRTQ